MLVDAPAVIDIPLLVKVKRSRVALLESNTNAFLHSLTFEALGKFDRLFGPQRRTSALRRRCRFCWLSVWAGRCHSLLCWLPSKLPRTLSPHTYHGR